MIIAFGQQLYLHFREDDLADLAKESGEKSVGAVNYGGKASCDEILAKAKKRLDLLESEAGLAEVLQRRAKLIAENAKFRGDDDAVPTSASVSTVYAIDENGVQLALSGGALQIGRVRADKGKEPAAEWAARAGIRVGERVESG